MGGLINLLLANEVYFPDAGSGVFSFIGKFVYILIDAMHSGGVIAYGLAIILFTVILKLIMLPLDFGNRFFTKRNTAQLAKLKPEEDAIREQYANEPLQLNRARQEMYKKNGYNMTGFCLFTVLNLTLTLIIFISVFGALRGVADYNINKQFIQLRDDVYMSDRFYDSGAEQLKFISYGADDEIIITDEALEAEFNEAINTAYNNTRISFLWVANIWRSDTPWTGRTYDWAGFSSTVSGTQDSVLYEYITDNWDDISKNEQTAIRELYLADTKQQYETMFQYIKPNQKGANGWLLLVLLAGAMTFASVMLSNKLMGTSNKNPAAKKEAEAQYSMRKVKNQADKPQKPTVDPQMMNKVMKYMLPAIMIIFTMTSTAALAIYIITSSLMGTLITLGLNWPVDKLIKWEQKRKDNRPGKPDSVDPDIINPHAKYFKKKK